MLPLCHSRICIPVLTNVILVPQRGVEQSHARHRHVPERRQTAVFSILVTERSQSGHALPSGNRSVKARLIPTTISVPARSSQCVRCRSDPYPVHHKPQRRNNICKNHSVAIGTVHYVASCLTPRRVRYSVYTRIPFSSTVSPMGRANVPDDSGRVLLRSRRGLARPCQRCGTTHQGGTRKGL